MLIHYGLDREHYVLYLFFTSLSVLRTIVFYSSCLLLDILTLQEDLAAEQSILPSKTSYAIDNPAYFPFTQLLWLPILQPLTQS